ncbi:MAG: hypothetical protein ACE5KM_21960, partial [Planctomycetaceae bacterium]
MQLSKIFATVLVGLVLASDVGGTVQYAHAQNKRGFDFDNDDFGRRNDPFGRPKGANDADMRAFWAVFLVAIAIGLAIGLAIQALICWFISGAIGRVPAEYREMEPGAVWLLMIPLFNLIWLFFVVQRIPRSFQNYFEAHERHDYGDCGAQLGLWYAICSVGSMIPYLGACVGIAALILMIMFLVKPSEMK